MTLHPIPSKLPYVRGIFFLFYQCILISKSRNIVNKFYENYNYELLIKKSAYHRGERLRVRKPCGFSASVGWLPGVLRPHEGRCGFTAVFVSCTAVGVTHLGKIHPHRRNIKWSYSPNLSLSLSPPCVIIFNNLTLFFTSCLTSCRASLTCRWRTVIWTRPLTLWPETRELRHREAAGYNSSTV